MHHSKLITILALTAAASPAMAANLATQLDGETITSTITVGAGDTYQLGAGKTVTIGTGGLIDIQAASTPNSSVGSTSTATLIINGGSLNVNNTNGRSFLLGNGSGSSGTLTLLDGSLNVGLTGGSFFIGRDNATGLLTISGGSATFSSAQPSFDQASGSGSIDFTTGSTGSLTITGADLAYYQGLYSGDDLTYNGTNTATFGDVFSVSGSTLTVIPEPGSLSLLGLAALGLTTRRRRP